SWLKRDRCQSRISMPPLRDRWWISRLASPHQRSDLAHNRMTLPVARLQSRCANAGLLPSRIPRCPTQARYDRRVRRGRATEDDPGAEKNRLARLGFPVAEFCKTAQLRKLDTRCDS